MNQSMEQTNGKLKNILEVTLTQFESSLISNSITDIHSDYFTTSNELEALSVSNVSKENILSLRVMHIFTNPECKDKIVSCIDVNNSNGTIAIGLMSHRSLDERVLKSNRHNLSNYIFVWPALGALSSPLKLLCPDECSVCKFHPKINDYIVAGCANGQVCLFDLNSKNSRDGILPTYTSVIQKNHSRMVTDILWLPHHSQSSHLEIDDYNSDNNETSFATVGGGDGNGILFWDICFQKVMKGKKKYKQDCDDNIWKPFLQIKPKRLHGTSDISIQKFMHFPDELVKTKILCASESGDIICIDWSPDSDFEENSSLLSNQFIKWMIDDKFSGSSCCEVLCPSPFFPNHILYANAWNFQVWNTSKISAHTTPFILRPQNTSKITCGCWSPTRASLLYIGKMDGTIDVWDFLQSSLAPTLVISTENTIMSMKILRNLKDDRYLLVIGDNVGSVQTFLLPESLTVPLAKEKETMEQILTREADSHVSIPMSTLCMFDSSVLLEEILSEETPCLSDEQERSYNEFCRKIGDF